MKIPFTNIDIKLEWRSGFSNPDAYLIKWLGGGGSDTASGVTINQTTALSYIAVYSCINLLSRMAGCMPLKLMRRTGNDTREVAPLNHYGQKIVAAPNPEMTPSHYKITSMGHLASWGNWYSQIIRTKGNVPVELWLLRPDRMNVDRVAGELVYKYTTSEGKQRKFNRDEILHIPGFGYDGIVGYSPITIARETIGLGLAAQQYSSLFFKNGAIPSGNLVHPNRISPEVQEKIKQSVEAAIGGEKRHGILVTQEGMEWKSIGIPAEDAQLLQTMKFSKGEIADLYLIPRHMIGDLEHATFSNIEEQNIQFSVITMMPWFIIIEEAINKALLLDIDKAEFYYKFNMSALMRGNAQARSQYYREMFNIGVFSINNILALEDMNRVDDPMADEHFVPLNMVPLSNAGILKPNDNGKTQKNSSEWLEKILKQIAENEGLKNE